MQNRIYSRLFWAAAGPKNKTGKKKDTLFDKRKQGFLTNNKTRQFVFRLEAMGASGGGATTEDGRYSCVSTLRGHTKAISSVSWWCGDRLLSTSADGSGRVWIFSEEKWSSSASLVGHGEGLNDGKWWRDGRICGTASDDKTVRIWDVERGRAVSTLSGHDSYVFCVDVNPFDTLLASGSYDETIKFWDIRIGKAIRTIAAHSDPVTAVSFDKSDGSKLASTSYDGLMRLWDTGLGECLATTFAEQTGFKQQTPVSHCEFSKNGRFVLTGNHDSSLRLWHVAEPPCAVARKYTGGLNSTRFCGACTFHAQCERRRRDVSKHAVVSGSEDGRLLVWNLQSAQIETTIENAHDDAVLAVSAHPRRDLIATGGMTKDATVKLWEWSPAATEHSSH